MKSQPVKSEKVALKIKIRKRRVSLLFVLVTLITFMIWDNNRVILTKQKISIEQLPKELDGFKILQISDLHGKEFGKDQKRLLKLINSTDYDAIVFTGDMLMHRVSNDYKAFYQLLDGIKKKENAIFIPGNEDPESYYVNPTGQLEKSSFIKGIEKRGVRYLESVYTLKKEDSKIHFVDFEMSILNKDKEIQYSSGIFHQEYTLTVEYLDLKNKLLNEMSSIDHLADQDVLIGLVHNPVVDKRIDSIVKDSNFIYRDYDLILAGHYHGGQIRLPLIGALFVPEAWNKRNGLFPPQDRVKGLWEYKHTKQYVSAGLGNSDAIPFLTFRLFNPPEINLLTLKQK